MALLSLCPIPSPHDAAPSSRSAIHVLSYSLALRRALAWLLRRSPASVDASVSICFRSRRYRSASPTRSPRGPVDRTPSRRSNWFLTTPARTFMVYLSPHHQKRIRIYMVEHGRVRKFSSSLQHPCVVVMPAGDEMHEESQADGDPSATEDQR